jgi:hypothetical protein
MLRGFVVKTMSYSQASNQKSEISVRSPWLCVSVLNKNAKRLTPDRMRPGVSFFAYNRSLINAYLNTTS